MSRTFTVDNSGIDVSGGRYVSDVPSQAAKKAASKLFAKAKSSPKHKAVKTITFSIRETTRNSDKSQFKYKATQKALPKPIVRVINGKEIINKYEIKIVAV